MEKPHCSFWTHILLADSVVHFKGNPEPLELRLPRINSYPQTSEETHAEIETEVATAPNHDRSSAPIGPLWGKLSEDLETNLAENAGSLGLEPRRSSGGGGGRGIGVELERRGEDEELVVLRACASRLARLQPRIYSFFAFYFCFGCFLRTPSSDILFTMSSRPTRSVCVFSGHRIQNEKQCATIFNAFELASVEASQKVRNI